MATVAVHLVNSPCLLAVNANVIDLGHSRLSQRVLWLPYGLFAF